MRMLPGARAMRLAEDYTIKECGVPSLVLMERAALAVRDEALKYLRPKDRVLIVSGVGNNGADGLAAARLLSQAGMEPSIMVVGSSQKWTSEFAVQAEILSNMGLKLQRFEDLENDIDADAFEVVIDALFGIGLSRDLSGEFEETVGRINAMNAVKIAVDIPSGIDTDTGAVRGAAVRCDVTVAFTYEKLGSALLPGAEYSGRVTVHDVGHLDCDLDGRRAFTYGREDLDRLPFRPADSHKGTFGHVLVVAGAPGMSGAAALCARAAYRTGAGLVYVLTPESNRLIIQQQLPEAVVLPYDPNALNEEAVADAVRKMEAVAIGPGLGRAHHVLPLINTVLQNASCPVVCDADALNTIADHPELTDEFRGHVIVTPHAAEMARLCGMSSREVIRSGPEAAADLALSTGAVCVLKGTRTVVSAGTDEFYVNMSGDNGMATGGSGDVLTGIIAALCAAGMTRMNAAVMGVYIHGLAGEAASRRLGTRSVMAGDIAEGLAEVLKDY